MKDSELLAEVKAREELEARGWKRIPCELCNGIGDRNPNHSNAPSIVPELRCVEHSCWKCDGKGWIWEAPITK